VIGRATTTAASNDKVLNLKSVTWRERARVVESVDSVPTGLSNSSTGGIGGKLSSSDNAALFADTGQACLTYCQHAH
jgi:hypothetical protein